MKVMGIDGGLASSGIAVIDNGKWVDLLDVIQTSKKKATPNETARMLYIFDQFSYYVKVHKPDIVIVENQYSGPNKATGLLLARVRGAYQIACGIHKIPFYTVSASSVKKTVTGKGNADKTLVQEAVKKLYPGSNLVQTKLADIVLSGKKKTDDMADAVAIAHTFIVSPNLATLT